MDQPQNSKEIAAIQGRLAQLDVERRELEARLAGLTSRMLPPKPLPSSDGLVTVDSAPASKIALFRSLFRGREDVYPKRWTNSRNGKSGYAPACANEWAPRLCGKPKVKCGDCPSRALITVTDTVINQHLRGEGSDGRDFTIGVYPMLADETCWFLAADFDKKTWQRDVAAFLATCEAMNVPAALERSRSGKGGHVWIFFSEPVPAASARRLGSLILTDLRPVSSSIRDDKGRLIAKAGTRINPLDYVTLSKDLLFVDGRDEAQVTWALAFEHPAKIVLVAGPVTALMREHKRPLYFDQKGLLTRRFQIAAVPASVTQDGRRLRIREFPLNKKSAEDAR